MWMFVLGTLYQTWTLSVWSVRAEMFTAMVDLHPVLQVEKNIASELRRYVEQEEKRLETLKRMAKEFESHSSQALLEPDRHLGNPVNSFLLVKRFTTDWANFINKYIRHNATEEFISSVSMLAQNFPSAEDLTGAASALFRLQDTYALSSDKLTQGDLQGIQSKTKLTAEDCFILGSVAYNKQDYYHTVLWMKEALNVLETEGNPTIDKSEILDYYSYSTYMQGNLQHALNLTNEWLKLAPSHIRAQNNKKFYEETLQAELERAAGTLPSYLMDIRNPRSGEGYKLTEDFFNYERLCRGEKTMKYEYEHLLTCQYRRHHPFFYIRPLKEEVMYLDPRILVFHDILTEAEMNKVKELAQPRLFRSVVYHDANTAATTAQDYRISKSAWLSDHEDPLIRRVSLKARFITNLTLDSAEQLQVLNYGIGGQYEPHFDFARRKVLSDLEQRDGNRVATSIFYISQVNAGGATVFPDIGVRIAPEKGACAFWGNLKKSGDGDLRTRHAGCPVLVGYKWVCNKWFHERGQEFVRPCTTDPDQ